MLTAKSLSGKTVLMNWLLLLAGMLSLASLVQHAVLKVKQLDLTDSAMQDVLYLEPARSLTVE